MRTSSCGRSSAWWSAKLRRARAGLCLVCPLRCNPGEPDDEQHVAKGDQAGDENRASSGGGKVADEKEQVGGTAEVPRGSDGSIGDQQNRQHDPTAHQTGPT
jgi:hypothetical protein